MIRSILDGLEAMVRIVYEAWKREPGWCWCGHEMRHHVRRSEFRNARCPLEGCCCDRPRRIR